MQPFAPLRCSFNLMVIFKAIISDDVLLACNREVSEISSITLSVYRLSLNELGRRLVPDFGVERMSVLFMLLCLRLCKYVYFFHSLYTIRL